MTGSVPNVKKAKAAHEQRQQVRDANVAAMKRGTVATQLQGFINHAYKRPNAKPRGRWLSSAPGRKLPSLTHQPRPSRGAGSGKLRG